MRNIRFLSFVAAGWDSPLPLCVLWGCCLLARGLGWPVGGWPAASCARLHVCRHCLSLRCSRTQKKSRGNREKKKGPWPICLCLIRYCWACSLEEERGEETASQRRDASSSTSDTGSSSPSLSPLPPNFLGGLHRRGHGRGAWAPLASVADPPLLCHMQYIPRAARTASFCS
jgi:hypothetical protein